MEKMMDREQLIGEAIVDVWNSQHPPGTPVIVIQDDGSEITSKTRTIAWSLDCGEAVVCYEGRSGGYALSRVVPIAPHVA